MKRREALRRLATGSVLAGTAIAVSHASAFRMLLVTVTSWLDQREREVLA
jgi:hypothetical protein